MMARDKSRKGEKKQKGHCTKKKKKKAEILSKYEELQAKKE